MKKNLLLLISCMFISMNMQAQEVKVSLPDSITVRIGEPAVTLTAAFTPAEAISVAWFFEDNVLENMIDTLSTTDKTTCKIIGLKVGETKVTVQGLSGGNNTAECVITVVQPVTDMELNETLINLILEEDSVLRAITTPADVSNDSIIWTSSDSTIVDIRSTNENRYDTACYITAVKTGAAVITATTVDGNIAKTCQVIVTENPVEEFTFDHDSIDMLKGETSTIKVKIRPLEGTNKKVMWSMANNDISIARITTPGFDTICTIEARAAGVAKLVAFTQDSLFTDTCVITVFSVVESIVIDVASAILDVKTGDSVKVLTATVSPANAINSSLLWVNKNSEIVKIDSITNDSTKCYIKGFRAGIDTIYAITRDGSIKSNESIITVNKILADSVRITKQIAGNDTITMNYGDSFELKTTIYPLTTTNDTLKAESNYPDIVKIDSTETGIYLIALKGDTAKIYIETTDGSDKKDSIVVIVKSVPVTGLSLNADTIRIYEQSVDSLIASFLPVTATNKSIVWSTNDNSVVRIESSTGTDTICKFTALKADTALIYAVSSEDGTIKDSCVVIVKERFVYLESNTTTADGKIDLSITIPAGITFTSASFELQLPKGFGLTKDAIGYKTTLTNEAQLFADLQIDYVNDSTYIFTVSPKTNLTINPGTGTPLKIMNIYYTIYDNALDGNTEIYKATFKDITIALSDATIINEENVVNIKVFKDPTGNDIFDGSGELFAYIVDGRLYVNSDKAEYVYVYSLSGSLLYMKGKPEGPVVFDIKTQEKILIVKGSSGWAVKVANK